MPASSSLEPLMLDTSVLLNFLRIDRLDLIFGGWAELHIVEEVQAEVSDPVQAARLQTAIEQGIVQVYRVTDLNDIRTATDLYDRLGLGRGEAFSFVAAKSLGIALAIDDHKAIKRASTVVAGVTTLKTVDVMLQAIRLGLVSIQEADNIKEDWEKNHNFRLKVVSFGDLLVNG